MTSFENKHIQGLVKRDTTGSLSEAATRLILIKKFATN
jgi:hypothetical protein